jgi:hypothetical protein
MKHHDPNATSSRHSRRTFLRGAAGFAAGKELPDNGILFVGKKGSGGWSESPVLLPESRMRECPRPAPRLPRSVGHREEWIRACKDGKPEGALAGFAYSGPFTEALLVGNLAVRLRKQIEWDAVRMKAVNVPEADRIITKEYRKNWEVNA